MEYSGDPLCDAFKRQKVGRISKSHSRKRKFLAVLCNCCPMVKTARGIIEKDN